VCELECRYPSRDLEPESILEKVRSFFESRGFSISSVSEGKAQKVSVLKHGVGEIVKVEFIKGDEDFLIRFLPLVSSRSIGFLSSTLSLFGGGIFVVRNLKMREELERLESEFWLEMDSFFYGRF
jgi:hypothetical protein